MKIPKPPRERGYDGYYGGVGSRPAPKTWTPGGGRAHEDEGPVPRRFRGLRLRRQREKTSDTESPMTTVLLVAILVVVALTAVSLFARLVS